MKNSDTIQKNKWETRNNHSLVLETINWEQEEEILLFFVVIIKSTSLDEPSEMEGNEFTASHGYKIIWGVSTQPQFQAIFK